MAQTTVVIEIHNTSSGSDDYFCWTPVTARVRAITEQSDPVQVTLASDSPDGTGRVEFSRDAGVPVTPQTYSPLPALDLALPSDGSWVPILVSGARASTDGKDVSIVATDRATGSTVGRTDVMVRVRKDANELTNLERERLTDALASLHGHRRPSGPTNAYEKYADAHGRAGGLGIHGARDGFPLFLAWHRAFLLSLERELQAIDPRVTIPYWRFDRNSDAIFTEAFMGSASGPRTPAGTIVEFDRTNQLRGWRMGFGGPLVRTRNSTVRLQDIYPSVRFETLAVLFSPAEARVFGGLRGANAEIERRHHNYAHVNVGGWIGTARSPRDPMFFLLHSNVDRAWADWQARFGRFDPTSEHAYSPQGQYPGPSDSNRLPKGSYALDPMWPWSRDDGSSTPDDDSDGGPNGGFDMPSSPAGYGPIGVPTPASMIDYMDVAGNGAAHGVCYDDLRYLGSVN